MTTPIDLSQLPPPAIVEPLDYESILAALIADLSTRAPELAEALTLESEPARKLLEVAAYLELLIRARINDAARACMLATAAGADLEQLAAWWGVTRRAGDTDTALRARTQESLAALTNAGTIAAYRWHAREVSTDIADVGVSSPVAGTVRVVLLSTAADGIAPSALCAAVSDALRAEDVRPLCDTVTVQSAVALEYQVSAVLHIAPGPDAATLRAAALSAATAYCASVRRVGARVARSGLDAALHQPGVLWVDLTSPAADLIADATEAPICSALQITIEAPA